MSSPSVARGVKYDNTFKEPASMHVYNCIVYEVRPFTPPLPFPRSDTFWLVWACTLAFCLGLMARG